MRVWLARVKDWMIWGRVSFDGQIWTHEFPIGEDTHFGPCGAIDAVQQFFFTGECPKEVVIIEVDPEMDLETARIAAEFLS